MLPKKSDSVSSIGLQTCRKMEWVLISASMPNVLPIASPKTSKNPKSNCSHSALPSLIPNYLYLRGTPFGYRTARGGQQHRRECRRRKLSGDQQRTDPRASWLQNGGRSCRFKVLHHQTF